MGAAARQEYAMSQENVELVRRIYDEGLIDQDPAWLLDLATPDIEYVNPPYAFEPSVRRGPAEVVRAMRGFAEVWDDSASGAQSRTRSATALDPASITIASPTASLELVGLADKLALSRAGPLPQLNSKRISTL
jgi:hypothetical protein